MFALPRCIANPTRACKLGMQSLNLFLDSDLTLAKLAKQVGLTTNNLSQVLNQTFQQSFNQVNLPS